MGTFKHARQDWRAREWEDGGKETTGRRERGCRGQRQGGGLRPIFGDTESAHAKPDHKTAALCKQVGRAVSLALTGECGDPVLQGLIVEEVLPAPNAGRLLVRVLWRTGPEAQGIAEVLQRLAAVEGLLRARVTEAIVRKRAPELAFAVVPLGLPHVGNSAESEVPHE